MEHCDLNLKGSRVERDWDRAAYRREVAMRVMERYLQGKITYGGAIIQTQEHVAQLSVSFADALIAELEKK